MTTNLSIRPTAIRDIPAIADIFALEVLNGVATFETDPPSQAEMEEKWDRLVTSGYPHLVAVQGDRAIGFAHGSPYRPRPAYRFTIETSVYIHADHRRQGIGHLLMTHLIDHCEQGPWHQAIAVVGDSDNHGSIGLHKSLGFEHVGTLKSVGHKFDRWLDTVILQRALKCKSD